MHGRLAHTLTPGITTCIINSQMHTALIADHSAQKERRQFSKVYLQAPLVSVEGPLFWNSLLLAKAPLFTVVIWERGRI